jgi:hypothetical protein
MDFGMDAGAGKVGTALFASGATTAVTARKARGTTSDHARCAAKRGADAAARRPYHFAIGQIQN